MTARSAYVQKLMEDWNQTAGVPSVPSPSVQRQIEPDWGAVPAAGAMGAGHHPGDGHDHGGTSWRGPTSGRSRPNHHGWAGLNADVQGYASALMDAFPALRFTSGYRDPQHNRRVGGVPGSWHTKGRAVDLVGSARDMAKAAAWARQNGAREVLVHNAGSGQHLHIAWG